ncbi:hypothetical protein V6N13_011139 [Hibiscus sabdariffa]|uniref:Uncharacterized protein n=1 Tax=Hibiscus sabdariffa TaxID=183260 RepID=A0ABR2SBI8_9ROSI
MERSGYKQCCLPFVHLFISLGLLFGLLLVVLGLGITLSYHRNLCHRSFKLPKWLEYMFAYSGALLYALGGFPFLVWGMEKVRTITTMHSSTRLDTIWNGGNSI